MCILGVVKLEEIDCHTQGDRIVGVAVGLLGG